MLGCNRGEEKRREESEGSEMKRNEKENPSLLHVRKEWGNSGKRKVKKKKIIYLN